MAGDTDTQTIFTLDNGRPTLNGPLPFPKGRTLPSITLDNGPFTFSLAHSSRFLISKRFSLARCPDEPSVTACYGPVAL